MGWHAIKINKSFSDKVPAMKIEEYLFITFIPKSTLIVKVSSMDQIDLFWNY